MISLEQKRRSQLHNQGRKIQLDEAVIGVDLGGTKVLAGKVKNGEVTNSCRELVPKGDSVQVVVDAIIGAIDGVLDSSSKAIGIGVPSVIDLEQGIVYDVQNIPSWQKVPLRTILEEYYDLPVHLNNDANCFALGEKFFGLGRNYSSFVALIVGTGIATGIIINCQLYPGFNCGAGEFGTIPYLDHNFEYYASGEYFSNVHGLKGQDVYNDAMDGDAHALGLFEELGGHLGNVINVILYALDPEVIIMGGSVSRSYPLMKEAIWKKIEKIAFRTIPERLTIKVSENPDLAVLGAAALCYEQNQ